MIAVDPKSGVYLRAFGRGLVPPPGWTVSEWADRRRWLSSKGAAAPGKWSTDRAPYQREIMDCLSADHPAETVVFMASAQVGKTEVLLNWAGWVMDLRPAPMMLVLPTVGIAEDFSKQRVSGLIEATPSLAAKIGASRGRGASNTILNKEFPGGMLLMRGANSAAGLRSVPVQYLAMDEIDGYPRDVDGEGDPVKLAEARARTFARRKFFYCSTPTIKGESRIEEAYLETDQRKCFVPCPHCGVDQVLKFSQLRWPKGQPGKAAYLCEGCDDLIPETAKPWMLKNHRWVRTNPDAPPEKVGFHINALYSPLGWFSWAEIAAEFLDSHKSSFRLRTFVNTVLGETWESKGERPDWEKIYLRRGGYERGIVPEDGLVLTAGVDVQADRLECEVVAWGKGMKSWSVDYFVFPGDPARDETWDQLAELIDRQWPHASGGTLSLSRMCIDSGYATASVYKFCSRYLPTQVVAVKGRNNLVTPISAPRPVQTTAQGKHVRSGATLYHVGTEDNLRVCGGTCGESSDLLYLRGQSPRVRRNRSAPLALRQFSGTISACAEEPVDIIKSADFERDNLRVCGGTMTTA